MRAKPYLAAGAETKADDVEMLLPDPRGWRPAGRAILRRYS